MDLMNKIIDDVCREQVSTHEKLVVDAFQKHFGISIYDVDLREIPLSHTDTGVRHSFMYKSPETLMSTRIHKALS